MIDPEVPRGGADFESAALLPQRKQHQSKKHLVFLVSTVFALACFLLVAAWDKGSHTVGLMAKPDFPYTVSSNETGRSLYSVVLNEEILTDRAVLKKLKTALHTDRLEVRSWEEPISVPQLNGKATFVAGNGTILGVELPLSISIFDTEEGQRITVRGGPVPSRSLCDLVSSRPSTTVCGVRFASLYVTYDSDVKVVKFHGVANPGTFPEAFDGLVELLQPTDQPKGIKGIKRGSVPSWWSQVQGGLQRLEKSCQGAHRQIRMEATNVAESLRNRFKDTRHNLNVLKHGLSHSSALYRYLRGVESMMASMPPQVAEWYLEREQAIEERCHKIELSLNGGDLIHQVDSALSSPWSNSGVAMRQLRGSRLAFTDFLDSVANTFPHKEHMDTKAMHAQIVSLHGAYNESSFVTDMSTSKGQIWAVKLAKVRQTLREIGHVIDAEMPSFCTLETRKAYEPVYQEVLDLVAKGEKLVEARTNEILSRTKLVYLFYDMFKVYGTLYPEFQMHVSTNAPFPVPLPVPLDGQMFIDSLRVEFVQAGNKKSTKSKSKSRITAMDFDANITLLVPEMWKVIHLPATGTMTRGMITLQGQTVNDWLPVDQVQGLGKGGLSVNMTWNRHADKDTSGITDGLKLIRETYSASLEVAVDGWLDYRGSEFHFDLNGPLRGNPLVIEATAKSWGGVLPLGMSASKVMLVYSLDAVTEATSNLALSRGWSLLAHVEPNPSLTGMKLLPKGDVWYLGSPNQNNVLAEITTQVDIDLTYLDHAFNDVKYRIHLTDPALFMDASVEFHWLVKDQSVSFRVSAEIPPLGTPDFQSPFSKEWQEPFGFVPHLVFTGVQDKQDSSLAVNMAWYQAKIHSMDLTMTPSESMDSFIHHLDGQLDLPTIANLPLSLEFHYRAPNATFLDLNLAGSEMSIQRFLEDFGFQTVGLNAGQQYPLETISTADSIYSTMAEPMKIDRIQISTKGGDFALKGSIHSWDSSVEISIYHLGSREEDHPESAETFSLPVIQGFAASLSITPDLTMWDQRALIFDLPCEFNKLDPRMMGITVRSVPADATPALPRFLDTVAKYEISDYPLPSLPSGLALIVVAPPRLGLFLPLNDTVPHHKLDYFVGRILPASSGYMKLVSAFPYSWPLDPEMPSNGEVVGEKLGLECARSHQLTLLGSVFFNLNESMYGYKMIGHVVSDEDGVPMMDFEGSEEKQIYLPRMDAWVRFAQASGSLKWPDQHHGIFDIQITGLVGPMDILKDFRFVGNEDHSGNSLAHATIRVWNADLRNHTTITLDNSPSTSSISGSDSTSTIHDASTISWPIPSTPSIASIGDASSQASDDNNANVANNDWVVVDETEVSGDRNSIATEDDKDMSHADSHSNCHADQSHADSGNHNSEESDKDISHADSHGNDHADESYADNWNHNSEESDKDMSHADSHGNDHADESHADSGNHNSEESERNGLESEDSANDHNDGTDAEDGPKGSEHDDTDDIANGSDHEEATNAETVTSVDDDKDVDDQRDEAEHSQPMDRGHTNDHDEGLSPEDQPETIHPLNLAITTSPEEIAEPLSPFSTSSRTSSGDESGVFSGIKDLFPFLNVFAKAASTPSPSPAASSPSPSPVATSKARSLLQTPEELGSESESLSPQESNASHPISPTPTAPRFHIEILGSGYWTGHVRPVDRTDAKLEANQTHTTLAFNYPLKNHFVLNMSTTALGALSEDAIFTSPATPSFINWFAHELPTHLNLAVKIMNQQLRDASHELSSQRRMMIRLGEDVDKAWAELQAQYDQASQERITSKAAVDRVTTRCRALRDKALGIPCSFRKPWKCMESSMLLASVARCRWVLMAKAKVMRWKHRVVVHKREENEEWYTIATKRLATQEAGLIHAEVAFDTAQYLTNGSALVTAKYEELEGGRAIEAELDALTIQGKLAHMDKHPLVVKGPIVVYGIPMNISLPLDPHHPSTFLADLTATIFHTAGRIASGGSERPSPPPHSFKFPEPIEYDPVDYDQPEKRPNGIQGALLSAAEFSSKVLNRTRPVQRVTNAWKRLRPIDRVHNLIQRRNPTVEAQKEALSAIERAIDEMEREQIEAKEAKEAKEREEESWDEKVDSLRDSEDPEVSRSVNSMIDDLVNKLMVDPRWELTNETELQNGGANSTDDTTEDIHSEESQDSSFVTTMEHWALGADDSESTIEPDVDAFVDQDAVVPPVTPCKPGTARSKFETLTMYEDDWIPMPLFESNELEYFYSTHKYSFEVEQEEFLKAIRKCDGGHAMPASDMAKLAELPKYDFQGWTRMDLTTGHRKSYDGHMEPESWL